MSNRFAGPTDTQPYEPLGVRLERRAAERELARVDELLATLQADFEAGEYPVDVEPELPEAYGVFGPFDDMPFEEEGIEEPETGFALLGEGQ